MNNLKKQLISVWARNQKANLQLIGELNEEALDYVLLKAGKTTIAQQFAHVHTIRYYNIEKLDAGKTNNLKKLGAKDALTKALLIDHLESSALAITKIIEEAASLEKIKGYKNGYLGFITYLINHEAHHRGKVLLTLKQNGFPFSKVLKFDLWNWK